MASNPQCTTAWITEQYPIKIIEHFEMSVEFLQDKLRRDLGLIVKTQQVYRTKRRVMAHTGVDYDSS